MQKLVLIAAACFLMTACQKETTPPPATGPELATTTAPNPGNEVQPFCPNNFEPCNNTSYECSKGQKYTLSNHDQSSYHFLFRNYMAFNEWDNWLLYADEEPVWYQYIQLKIDVSQYTTKPWFSVTLSHHVQPPGIVLGPPTEVSFNMQTGSAQVFGNGNNLQVDDAFIEDNSCVIVIRRNWSTPIPPPPPYFLPTFRFRISNSFSTGDGDAAPFCYAVNYVYLPM